MKLTKYQEKKVIRELQKSYSDKEVAKRMAFMREINLVDDYKHMSAEQALAGIIVYLQELVECDNCKELEHEDDMNDGYGFDNLCHQCLKDIRIDFGG